MAEEKTPDTQKREHFYEIMIRVDWRDLPYLMNAMQIMMEERGDEESKWPINVIGWNAVEA